MQGGRKLAEEIAEVVKQATSKSNTASTRMDIGLQGIYF
jgi:hypothetical protein